MSNYVLAGLVGLLIAGGLYGWSLYKKYRIAPEMSPASIAFTDLDGSPVDWTSRYGDQPVVVNFWQTWCPPCRKEMPDLEKARVALESEGFAFVLVSDEDPGLIRNFQAKHSYGLEYLLTPSLEDIGIHTYPTTYLFGPNAEVLYKKVGVEEWDSEAILREFRDLVSS